jgi:hypothetical protein
VGTGPQPHNFLPFAVGATRAPTATVESQNCDLDRNIAANRVGIGAGPVGFNRKDFGFRFVDAGEVDFQLDLEANPPSSLAPSQTSAVTLKFGSSLMFFLPA